MKINVNISYKIGERYLFDIINFKTITNKKGEKVNIIIVEDNNKNKIEVYGFNWQTSIVWKFKKILCEIKEISYNGILKLKNVDYKHPTYKINGEYEFEILRTKIKKTDNGEFNVYELLGNDGCLYEVNMLPGQNLYEQNLKKIWCKVIKITSHIKLIQTKIKDPYFFTFGQILNNYEYEKKYFLPFISNREDEDYNIIQLNEQYSSEAAFWVFTYTNKILPKLFNNSIKRYDYEQAYEINEIIIKFEKWIINKGIISSFANEEYKKTTKFKAQNKLDTALIANRILTELKNNPLNILNKKLIFEDKNYLDLIFIFLMYSNFEIIDFNIFYNKIIKLIFDEKLTIIENNYKWLKIVKVINSKNTLNISDEEKQDFNLSNLNLKYSEIKEQENIYSKWKFLEILISKKFGFIEHFNISCGKLLNLSIKRYNDIKQKEVILLNAYKFLDNFQLNLYDNPFIINNKNNIDLDFNTVEKNLIEIDQSSWFRNVKHLKSKESIKFLISKKSKAGYEVYFNNIKGFLPNYHIKTKELKTYPFEENKFYIHGKCISLSNKFEFFIIEQTENTNINPIDGSILIPVIGMYYTGIIKKIEAYGIFVTTMIGEGLIHHSKLVYLNGDYINYIEEFKIGQKIKIELLDINDKKQLFFSLKYENKLYDKDNFDNLIETASYLENDSYVDIAIIEKALCIEQYAVLQHNLNEKIHNFKIAKQLYSNVNNYRSYLINIYISYFEILRSIEDVLNNKSIENIKEIKNSSRDIIEKIDEKTIKIFPDSEKLIFFLNIIYHFNERDDESLNILFDYLNKYKNDDELKDLRTITKITLANNLLISESKEDSIFVLKNLKLIYDYISNGILSLEESLEDKNERINKEEILFWRSRISEDESENLEFKSTLFTPILDDKTKLKIEKINGITNKSEKNIHELKRLNGELTPKILIHSVLKTIVAFANSSGGTLLIGVNNEKKILGIDNEYNSLSIKLQYSNRDGYGLYFDELIRNYIGDSFSSLLNRKFLRFPEGDVLIVNIKPSPNEIFLLKDDEGKSCEQLFIRNLSSSQELKGTELAKFVRNKFNIK